MIPKEWKRPQWAEQSQETKDHIMDYIMSEINFDDITKRRIHGKSFLQVAQSDDWFYADLHIIPTIQRLLINGSGRNSALREVGQANAVDEAYVKASKKPEDVMAWAFHERIWKIWQEREKNKKDVTAGHTEKPPVREIYIGGVGQGFVLY